MDNSTMTKSFHIMARNYSTRQHRIEKETESLITTRWRSRDVRALDCGQEKSTCMSHCTLRFDELWVTFGSISLVLIVRY